jgi:hypothetical protein
MSEKGNPDSESRRDADIRRQKATSGIGVVDTTSLWAAAKLLGYGGPNDPRRQEEVAADRRYFLSLLHSITLYDELRTDSWILSHEAGWYSDAVKGTLSRLEEAVKVTAMPGVDDHEAMLHVLPAFVAGIREAAGSQDPDLRSAGTLALISARAYARGGLQPPDPLLLRYAERGTPLEGVDPEVRREIEHLAKDPRVWGRGFRWFWCRVFGGVNERQKQEALLRSLSIAARSVKYAAHSSSIQKEEGRPAAFCASPRRIEILRGYLSREALSSLEAGADRFADLLPKLGLPTEGYDFTVMRDPLPLTAMSRAVRRLSAQEALDRVVALRSTLEGRQLRQAWAARLWDSGPQALEGHARGRVGGFQSMRNVFARDIRQEVQVHLPEMTLVIAAPAGAAEGRHIADRENTEEIGKAVIQELERGL